ENVPSASVAAIAERALVRPAGSVLHTTQHRGREKRFLSQAGLPVAPHALVEAFVDFERELSVVAARGVDGRIAHYGVIENAHARHVLDVSVAPARVPPQVERDAIAIARATLEALDVVGVLCIELFLTRDGRVLVNELAPRT